MQWPGFSHITRVSGSAISVTKLLCSDPRRLRDRFLIIVMITLDRRTVLRAHPRAIELAMGSKRTDGRTLCSSHWRLSLGPLVHRHHDPIRMTRGLAHILDLQFLARVPVGQSQCKPPHKPHQARRVFVVTLRLQLIEQLHVAQQFHPLQILARQADCYKAVVVGSLLLHMPLYGNQ